MSANRCPKCDLLNLPAAVSCLKCRTPLDPAPADERRGPETDGIGDAKTEVLRAGTEQFPNTRLTVPDPVEFRWAPGAGASGSTPFGRTELDSQPKTGKIGSRTFFCYRMLCSVVTVFGIILGILGIFAIIGSTDTTGDEAASAFTGGIMFLVAGAGPAFLCLLGVLFPPRRWSWVFGLALLVLMTLSCWLIPFSVPLLVFWIKSETQSYFGRS